MLRRYLIGVAVCIASLIVSISWAQTSDLFVVIAGRKVSNVITVAKRGGNFTSVQGAVDSITDATSLNPYLVVIAPGFYDGVVNLKPDVHLQGAGQNVTMLHSTVGNDGMLPTQATVVLDDRTSVRDLTILNWGGTDYHHVALMVARNTADASATDVTVYATIGDCSVKSAIYFYDSDSTLVNVTADASGGSNHNYGARITEGATVVMHGGSFTGRGGSYAYGISGEVDSYTILEITNTAALAVNGNNLNTGISVEGQTTLRGGTFTGRGGNLAYGIVTKASLDALNCYVLAENGTSANVGISFIETSGHVSQSVIEGATNAWETIGPPSITVSHSRLIGGPAGGVTCVAVSRGTTFNASGCP